MTPKKRFDLIRMKYGLNLSPGEHTIQVACEMCRVDLNAEIRVYRTGNGTILKSEFVLHHADGNKENNDPNNIMILCEKCHRMLHLLGEIQRWMDKIGKTYDELPDCRGLKPLIKRYGPGYYLF